MQADSSLLPSVRQVKLGRITPYHLCSGLGDFAPLLDDVVVPILFSLHLTAVQGHNESQANYSPLISTR